MPKSDWNGYFKVGLTVFLLYLAVHYWPWATGLFSAVFSAATPMILGCAITETTGIYALLISFLILFATGV